MSWSQPRRPGEGEALEQLLAEARPRLLALAMRVLGDTDEAEDAVQDATIKVWRISAASRGAPRFRPGCIASRSTPRWTGCAAAAPCRSPSGTPDEHHHDGSQLPVPETPERIYARAETAVVVRRAMAQLSETHGEALRLCDLEGESYATIAAVTECPLGTVMSRLFHARRKLARELSETATSEGDLEALRAA